MTDDEHHEAMGAMIHRGKVEQAAGRDYHNEIVDALRAEVERLTRERDEALSNEARAVAGEAEEIIRADAAERKLARAVDAMRPIDAEYYKTHMAVLTPLVSAKTKVSLTIDADVLQSIHAALAELEKADG